MERDGNITVGCDMKGEKKLQKRGSTKKLGSSCSLSILKGAKVKDLGQGKHRKRQELGVP